MRCQFTAFSGYLTAAVALAHVACTSVPSLSDADRQAIEALDTAYVNAWLQDDTAGVLATLAPDAVLMPGGVRPITGDAAIRQFWWPTDGSSTRVTAYTTTIDEIEGTASIAYVRGTGAITFTYAKDTVVTELTSNNMTLTVLTKQSDGRWLISRRMWAGLSP